MTNPQAPDCEAIARLVSVRLEVARAEVSTAHVVVHNGSTRSLWIPTEERPFYRRDQDTRQAVISCGVFEDSHRLIRARYLVPRMAELAPGQELRWRLTNQGLVDDLAAERFVGRVRIRASLRELPYSNVRGQQPFKEYL